MPDHDIGAHAKAFVIGVGRALRRAREQRQWTVEELCARVECVSAPEVEAFERGDGDLGVIQLTQLCQALGVDHVALINEAFADHELPPTDND